MDSGGYGRTRRVFISSTIFFAIGTDTFGYTACSVYPNPPYQLLTPYPPLPTIDPLLKVTTGYYRLLTVIKIMVLIMR